MNDVVGFLFIDPYRFGRPMHIWADLVLVFIGTAVLMFVLYLLLPKRKSEKPLFYRPNEVSIGRDVLGLEYKRQEGQFFIATTGCDLLLPKAILAIAVFVLSFLALFLDFAFKISQCRHC